jgi:UPF0716 protein FxsA
MRRLAVIAAILIIIPIIEIAVLIGIGQIIGLGWTLALMLATSALGAWLLRREGGRAWRAFQADLVEGRPPGTTATDGLLVLLGAIFMLVPGFVSDVIGVFMIAPPTRRLARALVLRVAASRMSSAVAMNLFGPRKVRVRQSSAARPPGPTPPDGTRGSLPIEGEIID